MGLGIPATRGRGTNLALPKSPYAKSLPFSPGLAATMTILTQHQASPLEVSRTYTLAR